MSFADDFAGALQRRGVTLDANVAPDAVSVETGIERISDWFWALDPAVREGFDAGTGEFAICHILAGDLGIAPELAPLMAAFDESQGQTLSSLLDLSREALVEASGQV